MLSAVTTFLYAEHLMDVMGSIRVAFLQYVIQIKVTVCTGISFGFEALTGWMVNPNSGMVVTFVPVLHWLFGSKHG